MRYKPMRPAEGIREKTMSTNKKCACIGRSTGDVSRRQLLQAGLAPAAIAVGTAEDLFGQNQAGSRSRNAQALRATGARALDIHAPSYPESFLDLITDSATRCISQD